MNLISAVERYQQQQIQPNNANELQKQQGLELLAPNDLPDNNDEFINSGMDKDYQTVATQFHPQAITFPDILSMRQTLYEHSLINLREANTLVVATQTYPDNTLFNLEEALDDYKNQDSSYEANVDVGRLKVITANIIAARNH
ncbi:hypothetical protein [Gynuella sunshinyii]|uniref:Uncharacterized protein n=1 Tax=Gynuella sunshinyii YC6258 TaxID=1445510 RepID=A0A0C5VAR0_9GAMM|nr:hypothetical protein [Gynuella sunshinyii]AJQ96425.1 hypothetical Protein YC6258_04393 [Gynuella sunshinyii YC6258]